MAEMVLDVQKLPETVFSRIRTPKVRYYDTGESIVLTPVAGNVDESLGLLKASESTLDFWDNEEDKVWDYV